MTNKIFLAMVAVAYCYSNAVAAADDSVAPQPRWYLAPSLGYVIADSDRAADDGLNTQLGVGRLLNEQWNIELTAIHSAMDRSNTTGEYDQGGIAIDGLYFFSRDRRWNPYGLLSVGSMSTETPGKSSTSLLTGLGAGVTHQLSERGLALRADGRYRYEDDDTSRPGANGFGDWVLNVGFTVPLGLFGPGSAKAAAPAGDRDGDGVNDDDDRCADTPAGTEVDGTGCMVDADHDGVTDKKDRCPKTPAARKVDANGCEIDSDKDGVVNDLDRCPNTPAGTKVGANGCELDADFDGVVDSKDACPGSRAGDKVDAKGCLALTEEAIAASSEFSVTADAFVLRGVTFQYDSSILTQAAETVLKRIAATLRERPEVQVEISGHTDNRGTGPYNTALSQERADAVRAFLISNGVTEANVVAKGYGPDKPIADNETEAGRAQNRRVELRVLNR